MRPPVRRVTISVYVMAFSLIAVLALVGWTIRENRLHQAELAAAVALRQSELNDFLRTELCERLALRDEIQISYLTAAYDLYRLSRPEYAQVFQRAIRAIELTRAGCISEIPDSG